MRYGQCLSPHWGFVCVAGGSLKLFRTDVLLWVSQFIVL